MADDTKLGQKLLEKMGWSKGKGLGRDEQGDLEPVRLKYKNDAEGVGYVAKDDQWIAHHEEFNAILGKLNGSEGPAPLPETVPVKSLEVRSKVSKARVHYHKFTRGKDLSRYSESDLASILGKRANNSNPSSDDEKTVEMKTEFDEEVPENVEVKEKVNESITDEEHSHGVTTINKGNIHEYFAAKMAALKGKQVAQPAENTSEMTNQDVLNAEKRVRINEDLNQVKEFCSKKRITEWSQETLAKSTDSSDSDTEKKKEKSKKKSKSKSKSTEAGEAVILDCCANQKDMEPPKSKKRKLEQEVSEPESEQMTPKKKRKKKEDKDNQENCPPVKANEEALVEMNQQKKKKMCTAEDTSDEVNEIKKNKKKKKKGKSDEDAEITQQTEAAEPSETGEPAKKKKKRNKSETAVAGSAETANQSDHPEAAETEPKKMKMKRGQSEDEDSCNAASSDEVTSTPDAENQETSGMKKKKKKKNKKNKKDVSEDSAPDAEAAPQAPQRETQSDRLAEMNDLPGTAEQASAQKTDSGAPSDPSGTENNYPVPDFSFIDKPSKVKESIVKYQKASFEMFKGSNLFSLVGYGNSS